MVQNSLHATPYHIFENLPHTVQIKKFRLLGRSLYRCFYFSRMFNTGDAPHIGYVHCKFSLSPVSTLSVATVTKKNSSPLYSRLSFTKLRFHWAEIWKKKSKHHIIPIINFYLIRFLYPVKSRVKASLSSQSYSGNHCTRQVLWTPLSLKGLYFSSWRYSSNTICN